MVIVKFQYIYFPIYSTFLIAKSSSICPHVGRSVSGSVTNEVQCVQKAIKRYSVTALQRYSVTASQRHSVTALQRYSIPVLQCYMREAFGRSIWKKHLGDVYIVKMIV